MRTRRFRRVAAVLLAVGLVAACGGGGEGGEGGDDAASGGTFVVSLLSDPRSLDPATSNHIVALQVTYQIFETLVKLELGGTEIVPGLARSWTSSDGGRVWTFRLEDGVRFHDGTPFNAAAVCANFERWYHFSGVLQAPFVSGVWQDVFGGFASQDLPTTPPESLYRSCAAPSDDEVVVSLSRPSGAFLSALASPPFSIASPDALQRYGADKVSGTADAPRFDGTFGTEHPVGTGPFKLERWTPKDRLVLVRNDDYRGAKAKLERVIFRYIPDGAARRQALETGEIDGYDPVDPPDIEPLRRAGFQVLERPAFNVGSLGINQAKPPLDRLEVRQAIAHALNRDALVRAKYPPGAVVAKEFTAPALWGYAKDVPDYAYDAARARTLLAQAGVVHPSVELAYPTGATDPIWVDTEGIASAFKADLEAVGFQVTLKPLPVQPDYLAAVTSGTTQLSLLTAYGDRSDPDSFLGHLKRPSPIFGFDDPPLFDLLARAEAEPDQARRQPLYEEANRLVMELLPAVPYVHVPVYIALSKKVHGHAHAPVPWDPYALITVD